jgi:hypothetical protein
MNNLNSSTLNFWEIIVTMWETFEVIFAVLVYRLILF